MAAAVAAAQRAAARAPAAMLADPVRPAEHHLSATRPRLALRRAAALAALGALLAALAPRLAGAAPLRVVATVEPIAMLVRELAPEGAEVHALVPPGASPHVFEPRPSDVTRLAGAALLVAVGGDLDGWIAPLAAASAGARDTLVLLELPGLPVRSAGGRPDPHVWLDPILVRDALAPALAERLRAAAPAEAAAIDARLADFQARLTRLDTELRDLLAARPRAYVAFHGAWRYFGARYGLEEVGVVEEAPGEEPTPRELAALAAAARAAGVRAILIEPQLDPRVARALAAEFDAATVLVDPNGDPADPARARYEDLLRWNARAFARALGGAP